MSFFWKLLFFFCPLAAKINLAFYLLLTILKLDIIIIILFFLAALGLYSCGLRIIFYLAIKCIRYVVIVYI